MFDFSDPNTHEYKNFAFFVDMETNEPRSISTLDKNQFPYPYVEEPEAPKIFCQEKLLTDDECDYLIWLANSDDMWRKQISPFWDERNTALLSGLQKSQFASSTTQRLALDIHNRIEKFISDSFGEVVYSDQIGIVRWPENSWQMCHIDEVDGYNRVAGCVVFLNDDYDGGEPFYPYFGTKTKPKKGMIYAHDAGHSHLHGVTQIKNGMRWTISSTWTRDPNRFSTKYDIKKIQDFLTMIEEQTMVKNMNAENS